ncbi:hypothetical protein OG440_14330 [Streptomyces sp. NBC_00637]|uniref:hypothetical protein n=1 Tax=Streptomyces sp. NBC_00637 TaxID=2903667 RepID=UPI00324D9CE0
MQARRGVFRGLALVALFVLAVTSCRDTTINQQAGGDAEACVQEAVCSDGGSPDGPDPSAADNPSPPGSGASSAGPDQGGDTTDGGSGGEGGDGSTGDGSGGGAGRQGATGSVAGEAVPVRVELSGGNLPDGLRDSVDGCSMGVCTDWGADDVVVGGKSFDTGFAIECTIACGENEHGFFQMKLAGKYAKLDATFGIAADSPGSDRTETLTVSVSDQGTGKVLHSEKLAYGRSYTLTGFDVARVGVLRISFEGAMGGAHGAVGSPVVRN